MKAKPRLFKISLKISIMVVSLIIISATVIGMLSYYSYRSHSIELISERLHYAAQYTASLIDPAQYREIMASKEPNEYHDELSATLTALVDELGLFHLHVGEIDPDTGFTGFAEAQIPGFSTGLGEITAASQYPQEAFDAMVYGEAFATEPITLADYGLGDFADTLLGIYAPVFDEKGDVLAIISATLVDTGIYYDSRDFAVRMLAIVLISILVLIWIPIIFTKRVIGQPISKLHAATDAIVNGDLSGELEIKSNDEFSVLSKNFAIMQASIRNTESALLKLTRRLEETLREAAEAGKEKTDFLGKVSHDMRTPMNAIIGMTELALKDKDPNDKDERIVSVKKAATELLGIIDYILDFSESESGKGDTHSEKNLGISPLYEETAVSFTAPDAQVLIVDDLYINLKVAEGSLAPYKMRVYLCSSGIEAVESIKGSARNYDLVLMDYMMPGVDGAEATRQIRELGFDVPIIALTANTVSGVKEMLLEKGFSDYLSKPIDTAKLNAMLEKWIPKEKQKT